MSEYLAWCEQMRYQPIALPGAKLQSTNKIKVVSLENGTQVLLKVIRPEVVYIPRIKILGEAAYSLFDYCLNPAERVTPNVCPISENIVWRQFIRGLPGEAWRGSIYKATGNLDAADLIIIDQIISDRFAQRIALLDFIFLCQDRSARNWIKGGHNRFWAIDNGMLWPYKGRYADKLTVQTGEVEHLSHPMEAMVSRSAEFEFKIGVFSSLYAGRIINDGLLDCLHRVKWRKYFGELRKLVGVLGYPFDFLDDWRFAALENRAKWLLRNRRFPTVTEAFGEWQRFIQPTKGKEVWNIEWEIENSDIK